jgi:hypothetical protein
MMTPNPASVRVAQQLAEATTESMIKMLTPEEMAIVVALPPNGALVGYDALPETVATLFRGILAAGLERSLLQHLIVVMPFGLNALGRRVRQGLTGVVDIPLLDVTPGGSEWLKKKSAPAGRAKRARTGRK